MEKDIKHSAFTLAEVLITLAIIGVVAALTIPVIMAKVQDKKIETAKKVFQTKILESAGIMYAKDDLEGTTSANFINRLSSYMKLTKICDSSHLSDCFPEKIINEDKEITLDSLKTPKSLGMDYTNDNNVGGIMADGTKFILSYDPQCSTSTKQLNSATSCMHMLVDLPISSNANKVGEDVMTYNATINQALTVGDLLNIGCYYSGFWEIACSDAELEAAKELIPSKLGEITGEGRYISCEFERDEPAENSKITSCQFRSGTPPIE